MSVYEVTDALLNELENYELVILNFANGDMVGHTGSLEAAIKAVEGVDECLGKIYQKVEEIGGTMPENLSTPDKSIKELEKERNILNLSE
jgi:2,3-bisphosphoglycerate-independent phosphoglycerate mutase